ncbi:hypothetical protein LDENG_00276050 [Lucifuga dentata]|nr:hypothetical protein LDENG_00276050 [Lucifuga dentata]
MFFFFCFFFHSVVDLCCACHCPVVPSAYHPFCMFEPNIFNFHTCYITDNHFPKDKTIFQFS